MKARPRRAVKPKFGAPYNLGEYVFKIVDDNDPYIPFTSEINNAMKTKYDIIMAIVENLYDA